MELVLLVIGVVLFFAVRSAMSGRGPQPRLTGYGGRELTTDQAGWGRGRTVIMVVVLVIAIAMALPTLRTIVAEYHEPHGIEDDGGMPRHPVVVPTVSVVEPYR